MRFLEPPSRRNSPEGFTLVVELALQRGIAGKGARMALAQMIERANGNVPTTVSLLLESDDLELANAAVKDFQSMRGSKTGDTKKDLVDFLRREYPEEMRIIESDIRNAVGSVTPLECALRNGRNDEKMASEIEKKNQGIPTPASIALVSGDQELRDKVADDLQTARALKEGMSEGMLKRMLELLKHKHPAE